VTSLGSDGILAKSPRWVNDARSRA